MFWPEAHVLASVKLKIAKLLKMRLKTLELHAVQLALSSCLKGENTSCVNTL